MRTDKPWLFFFRRLIQFNSIPATLVRKNHQTKSYLAVV